MGERRDGVMRCCYALLLAVRAKAESTKALSCFLYLTLLQIKGKNRRNSLLGGETRGSLR